MRKLTEEQRQRSREVRRINSKTWRGKALLKSWNCSLCHQSRRKLIAGLKSEKDSPAYNIAKMKVLACRLCRVTLSDVFRRVTGECDVCGSQMATHPKCNYCGILLGQGHEGSMATEKSTGELWCYHCTSRRDERGRIAERSESKCH